MNFVDNYGVKIIHLLQKTLLKIGSNGGQVGWMPYTNHTQSGS